MSERKVLQKYYPPDFDPSAITRSRKPKQAGPKVQTIRLMAPFPMKCTSCGEYIYKGRKFNARKETTDEKYYSISIFRFYIRCTRCSAEITFKTDPKNMDYVCERGAKRNFEPWRAKDGKQETDEERLDRIEAEEADKDAMDELETKMADAKTEMAIADALDEIRTRNARLERKEKDDAAETSAEERIAIQRAEAEVEAEKQIEEEAKRAFARRQDGSRANDEDGVEPRADSENPKEEAEVAAAQKSEENKESAPSFKRGVKRKKDFGAVLGIKKKALI